MKKTLKKVIAVLITLAILVTTLVISPFTVLAVGTALDLEKYNIEVWADPENTLTQQDVTDYKSGDKLATLGGINPFKRSTGSDNYYLFLPSTADCNSLKLWFDGTVSVDGVSLVSGQATNIFQDLNNGGVSRLCKFVVNGKSYNVTVMKSGDVGTIYIDTNSGSLSNITDTEHEGEEPGSIMVVQPNGDVDYVGVMTKITGRGNGTWKLDEEVSTKLPYNINLAQSASLLDMNSSKKWCLLANFNDGSLVKNQLTYDFAKYIGINYQPICKPVDLYINQQYLGSYQLSERVEIKSNKIDITDAFENLQIANGTVDPATGAIVPIDFNVNPPAVETTGGSSGLLTNSTGHTVGAYKSSPSLKDPDDYTGGYLYELEISQRWVDENAGFCAYNRQGWVIKSADYASENMVKYSYDLLYALGSSVYNNGVVPSVSTTTNCSGLSWLTERLYGARSITNPAPAAQYQGKKWSDILDADSAVRYYWTQEFFKNMDSSTSSTYFYKEADSVDSKLYAGPMWDMDNSIGYDRGNAKRWGYSWTSSDGWYTKNSRIYRWRSEDSDQSYSTDKESPLNFYAALATNCTDFWDMAERYWYSYISPAVDIISGKAVDKTGVLKSASEYINAVAKSGTMNNLRHNLNNDGAYDVQYHINGMTTWFNQRQSWINSEIAQISVENSSVSPVSQQTYTGYEIKPETTVTNNGVALEKGVDYTYSYLNNVDAGTATMTINGCGYYTGQKTVNFTINKANLSNYTVEIDSAAYKDMTLEAKIVNADSAELGGGVTYQWYRNGTALAGATDKEYVTTEGDVGSLITVTVTGDGVNVDGTATSNSCNIIPGSRPEGYTRTLAAWDYDYTAGSELLVTGDPNQTDYYYYATSGENMDSSVLRASVNATDYAEIKWSGSADVYVNDSTSVLEDESPVMGTSKTDGLAWGEYPYFVTSLSTAGYENIAFSAKLGGTKKGPRDWKLQYSLNGETYTDVPGASYSITENKNMELAFNNVILPAECNNQQTVYIRMVVTSNVAINGTDVIVNQTSGDASVNNIHITGSSLKVVTTLYEPTFVTESGSTLFDDNLVEIKDNNGGADIYYSVNGSEDMIYTGEFCPFNVKTASLGDTAEIVAYAKFNDVESEKVTATYTFGGVDIMNFTYDTYSTEVTAGGVASTGGVYDQSGRMTAYADESTQYVPLWNEDNKAFSVAPDDTVKWSENSGFTFKTTTAGYENVTFSCKAYTTASGPKSVSLQYSLNGIDFYDVSSNVVLPANSVLEDVFVNAKLPEECNNQTTLYIRLVTAENLTNSGDTLWNNNSKGNLYVNNVIVAGEDNGSYKMPYTNKSTNYFGASGVIEYISPDGLDMTYMVIDEDNKIVQSGTYPQTGIQLSTVEGFQSNEQEVYTVLIYVNEDEEESLVNVRSYQFKGDTVVKFNYNSSTNLFEDYVNSDFTSVTNTSGANSGTLSMYPNAFDPAVLTYTGTYGVKVSWTADNYFYFDVYDGLNNPDPEYNGFWLVETSSLGYKGLTLNLEQLSSNQGPRDWGVAYSTDGRNYTYIDNSNARAISNDASSDTVETYGNLKLPAECDNQEKLFIKIFINGGEGVDGTELDFATKGNTGINAIEINGVEIDRRVNIKTTVLDSPDATSGTIPWGNVTVNVDGEYAGVTDENGNLTLAFEQGSTHEITISGDGFEPRNYTVTLDENVNINSPLFIFDLNNDGIVNAKDYAIMSKDSKYSEAKSVFKNFINFDASNFTYADAQQ